MKVSAISNPIYTNKISKKNNISNIKTSTISRSTYAQNPTFGSYSKSFNRIMEQNITKFDDACAAFLELFNAAKNLPGAKKLSSVQFFDETILSRSAYFLFMSLSDYSIHPHSTVMKACVKSADNYCLNIIKDAQDNKILTYETLGISLLDNIRSKYDSQCPELTFHNPEKPEQFIKFTIDKDRDFCVNRLTNPDYGRSISYYYKGGMKRDNRYDPFVSNEATYYNRDGSKSFWKNLIGV